MAVSTSDNYNKIISLPGGKKFHSGAHVDFADGRSIEIDDRNIMQGYPSIQDKVSEEDTFELGGAYSSLLTLKLNNFENEFKDYNFKGAIIKPWIGLTTAVHWRDGEIVEKIQKGVFNVTEAPEVNSIISATAYDNLVKMDVKYSEKSTLTYPATLGQIATDACSVCGVNLATAAFPNSDYVVAKRPDSETITCREILKYVAQLAGCFAKCNKDGDIEIRWYEMPEHVFDIGKNAKTVSITQNDTVITGVQIQGNDDSKTVYTAGTNDYAIRVTDNPLAQDGLQDLVNAIGARLVNMKFRSYSISTPMNLAIETGDMVYLTDSAGIQHTTIVSGLQIEFGDYEQFSGDAESTDENQSERFDKADKAQETADNAQRGVDEAKTEITQLNGQIVLKADKGSLIAEINISPETIKISANKLELSGLVTIEGVESGETTIDGACIKTGKISADRIDVTDLAAQRLVSPDNNDAYVIVGKDSDISQQYGLLLIKNGQPTLALLSDLTNNQGATIYCPGELTILQDGNMMIIQADKVSLGGDVEVSGKLDVDSGIAVEGSSGKTELIPVKLSDGSTYNMRFIDGVYVSGNH